MEFTCYKGTYLQEYFKSIIRQQSLPMIRLIEQNDEFKRDESTKPCKGVFDKRLSTTSIDKNVVQLANCRRLCPALLSTYWVNYSIKKLNRQISSIALSTVMITEEMRNGSVQFCEFFSTPLVNCSPSTFSLTFHTPPLPKVNVQQNL